MARKDVILSSFLTHKLFSEKYNLKIDEIPSNIRDALKSDVPIIKAVALIVDSLESVTPVTDVTLRNQITQFLNESAL